MIFLFLDFRTSSITPLYKKKKKKVFLKSDMNRVLDELYSGKPLWSYISIGIQEGELLSCVKDITAAVQHVVAIHIIQRTYRAMLFCIKNGILSPKHATLVGILEFLIYVTGHVAFSTYDNITWRCSCLVTLSPLTKMVIWMGEGDWQYVLNSLKTLGLK